MFCQKTAYIENTDFAFQILTFQNPIWTRNMTTIQIMRYFFQRYKPDSLLTFSYMLPKLQLSIFPWLTHEHWQNYFMVQKKWVPVMGIDNVFCYFRRSVTVFPTRWTCNGRQLRDTTEVRNDLKVTTPSLSAHIDPQRLPSFNIKKQSCSKLLNK